jgi:polar amino acid transport system substrate-binding protein
MRTRVWVLMALMTFSLTVLQAQRTILIQADEWMPHNGDSNGKYGYMIDIARAVFEPLGYKVVYEQVPWVRAVQHTRVGQAHAVVGALKGDAPDFVFPEEEQGKIVNAFYVLDSTAWRYRGIESLRSVRLLAISDYAYFDELDAYIVKNPALVSLVHGDAVIEQMVQMLLRKRVDVLVEDKAVMQFFLSENSQSAARLRLAGEGSEEAAYIAFSPAMPDSATFARLLSEGTKRLRQSGELARILAVYGLTDWK